MMEESHLRKTAHTIQKIHCQILGIGYYDALPHDRLDKFEVLLGHFFQEETAKKLSSKIISRGSSVIFRILLVNCLTDDGIITLPVIRVLENDRTVFYDLHYRKYSNWNNFLCSNKFPKCLMLYPENGEYTTINGEVRIDTKKSPALKFGNRVDKLYRVVNIVSLATTFLPVFSLPMRFATLILRSSRLIKGYPNGLHGIKLCDGYKHDKLINDVAGGMKTGIYELLQDKVDIVEKVMNEVSSWKHQEISDEQLQFRITEICKNGDKMYETMSEMCLSFKVGNMESIKVNDNLIFQNVGEGKSALETLVNHASKKFPQLLTYAVEYAYSQNGNIDWDGFKPYFKRRIFEEKCSEFNINDARPDISWINAYNYEDVIFYTHGFHNQINLFRHNNVTPVSICIQDLVNLGKKLLGSIRVDVTIAKPATNCVVVISKMKKLVVLIAPEVNIGNCPFNGSYPVFIRAF